MRKIFYLLVTIASFYFAGRYHSNLLMIFSLVLLLFFLFSFLQVWWIGNRLDIKIENQTQKVFQGTAGEPAFIVKNHQFWPVPNFKILVTAGNTKDPAKKVTQSELSGYVDGRSETILSLRLTSEYSGEIAVAVEGIVFYDYLKLFSHRRSVQIGSVQKVFPRPLEMTIVYQSATNTTSDNQPLAEIRGNDGPDIFSVDGYQVGDHPKNIHWKLSARTGELMSKVYSLEENRQVVLWLDLLLEDQQKLADVDRFLTLTASLVNQLMVQGISQEVHLINGLLPISPITVNNPQSYQRLMTEIINQLSIEKKVEQTTTPHAYGSNTLSLNLKGELYVNQKLLTTFSEDYQQKLPQQVIYL